MTARFSWNHMDLMKTALLALLLLSFTPALVTGAQRGARGLPLIDGRGPDGTWQARDIANGPWVLQLKSGGNTLTGSVRQGDATKGSVVQIMEGRIEGNTIFFKAKSPDGDRTITFRGRLNANEISFYRQVDIRPGGRRGDDGVFGGAAPLQFVMQRIG